MQLVDRKLYLANMPALRVARTGAMPTHTHGLVSRLKASSASTRLLALMLAAFAVAASPALLSTVRSVDTFAFQIFVQAGHFGLIAFQIFGR